MRQIYLELSFEKKPGYCGVVRSGKRKDDNILLEVCGKQDLLWLLLPTVGRSGGILVMWDSRVMKVIDNLIGEFSVSIEVLKEDDIKWWFTAIYGP